MKPTLLLAALLAACADCQVPTIVEADDALLESGSPGRVEYLLRVDDGLPVCLESTGRVVVTFVGEILLTVAVSGDSARCVAPPFGASELIVDFLEPASVRLWQDSPIQPGGGCCP